MGFSSIQTMIHSTETYRKGGFPVSAQSSAVVKPKKQLGFWRQVWRQKQLVILSLPVIFVILFNYVPLWGWLVAFFNYKPTTGFNVFANEFRGLEYFQALFQDEYFWRGLRNSLGMGVLKIIFSYVFSLMLAVMINEVRVSWFKRTVQTISYLPHFVSWVVAANLIFVTFSPDNGIVNEVLLALGIIDNPISFMGMPNLFWLMVALADVWKSAGYNAIVYLAAMTSIDPSLYESADIDGAGRFSKIWNITLPSITPTIKILLVLSIGRLLSVGFEQVYLLKSASTTETASTLEVYIYDFYMKYGMWAQGSAMSIFNSLVSIVLIVGCNLLAKRLDGEGIM